MEKPQIATESLREMSSEFKLSAELCLQNLKDSKLPFDVVNSNMAKTVVAPSIFLLCVDIEEYGKEIEIENDFTQFCVDIGKNFEEQKAGTPDYLKARDGIGELVLKYLPRVMKKLNINADPEKVFNKVDVLALKKILAPDYGIPINNDETIDQYKNSLKQTVTDDDSFRKLVDELKASDDNNLTNDEVKCLKVGIALAQAGYIQSQLFRAVEEDSTAKVRRFDRPVFDINSNMRQRVYKDSKGDMEQKLDRLTFEVYKDVFQLKEVLDKRAKIAS